MKKVEWIDMQEGMPTSFFESHIADIGDWRLEVTEFDGEWKWKVRQRVMTFGSEKGTEKGVEYQPATSKEEAKKMAEEYFFNQQ